LESNKLNFLFYLDKNTDKKHYFFNDKFIPELIKAQLSETFKNSEIFISVHGDELDKYSEFENIIPRQSSDNIKFWKDVFSCTSSGNIAFIHGDSPFFDASLVDEIFDLHNEFISEFTFSENLPEGFACEIISSRLVEQLPDFEEDTLPLSQVIKKNINQFDVELYYKSPDIREKRLSFRNNSERDRRIMDNLYKINSSIPKYSDIEKLINDNPEALFLGPSYVEVELNGSCSLDCLFCYRKSLESVHGHMETETFKTLLSSLKEIGNRYTISLTGSGEPLDHPNFYTIAEMAILEELAERVIIETNGISADQNFRNFFKKYRHKLTVIFNINGYDAKTYSDLHGTDNFDAVHENIIKTAESDTDHDRVYVQVIKINETDTFENTGDQKSFLDRYYDFWEQTKIPIILQKQNTYMGRIEDRTYSDLSPIKRTPCWHLQRDLYILSDGTVAFCKQDIDGKTGHGNIIKDDINSILNRQKEYFLSDYSGKLCTNPDCSKCDEWYTFNF